MSTLSLNELSRMIDHTVLKPDTVDADIVRLCEEALRYGFAAVCISPTWITRAAGLCAGSNVAVATVIGFPHGNTLSAAKAYESECAIGEGATELDMVVNIGALKAGDYALVETDIAGVVEVAHASDAKVKVILETALLTDREKELGCEVCEAAGADYVKTSTGFASAGATIEDVALFKRMVGDRLGIKAAGGISSLDEAYSMIEAGATRLGCSRSVAIVEEARGQDERRERRA